MNGTAVAAGLLLACLGFALAFMPLRVAVISAALAVAAAFTAKIGPTSSPQFALAGCWLSLILAALSVYWPGLAQRTFSLCLAFSVNAGFWAGLAAFDGRSLTEGLPSVAALLAGVPAAWCVRRGWGIAPRIVTSWLLAVALLVGSLPYLVIHPGYVPDHRE